jgi:cytochrome c peroxidase
MTERLGRLGVACCFVVVVGCQDPYDPKVRQPEPRAALPSFAPEASGGAPTAPSPSAAATPAPAAGAAIPDVDPEPAQLALFQPLPASFDSPKNPATPAKIELGRMLYFDARLSKNHDVSCNSCHDLARFGIDGLATSPGHKKQLGTRNSPTVYNAAGQLAQFWDGRADDVEAQATMPILNPVEMAMPNAAAVEAVVASIPKYVEAFKKVFPGDANAVSLANIGKAIGAFERTLVTPSAWDRYLKGDKRALSPLEKRGFRTFVTVGCTQCHTGALVGGGMFQKLGSVKPWPDSKDQGRFEHTKKDFDKMMFKVPTLRNVEKTAPYFHDGSVKSLDESVKMMARHQLGRELTDTETADIVAWLKTLTGRVRKAHLAKPTLPPSSPKTPKPDPT